MAGLKTEKEMWSDCIEQKFHEDIAALTRISRSNGNLPCIPLADHENAIRIGNMHSQLRYIAHLNAKRKLQREIITERPRETIERLTRTCGSMENIQNRLLANSENTAIVVLLKYQQR